MALPAKKPGHEIGGLMIIAHPSGPPPMFRSKGTDTASPGPDKSAAKPLFGKPAAADPMAAHEAAETPGQESNEEYGAKLISDIEQAGSRMGLAPDEARSLFADFCDSVAKCLRGESGGSESAGAEKPTDEGAGY